MSGLFRWTICFLWLLCVSIACGQSNTADLYWKVDAEFQKYSSQDWQDFSNLTWDDPAAPVPIKTKQVMQSLLGARNQILRATHMRHCDFILGENQEAFHQYLSLVERAEIMLLLDTKIRIQQGDFDGAVQSLVSIPGLALHVQGDRQRSSTDRVIVMIEQSDRMIGYLAQIGALEGYRAAQLLEAFDRLDPADPIGIRKAEVNEIGLSLSRMKKYYEEGEFDTFQKNLSVWDVTDLDLKSVNPEQFRDAFDRGVTALDSIVKIMEITDNPDDRKDQIQATLDALYKDDLASKLFAWTKECFVSNSFHLEKMRVLVAERRALLNDISHGRLALNDVANAAFWYSRGTKAILEIPEEVWSVLVQEKPKADEAVSVESRWREQLDSALKEFRKGSGMKNCDWSVLRRAVDGSSNSIHIAPAYIAGIWRAVEYLNAMSIRESPLKPKENTVKSSETKSNESPAKHDPSPTADVAIAVRLVAHLAGDDVLASSCAAHELIRKLKPSLERIAINDQMPNDDLERVRVAVWLLQPEDPFSYVKSGKSTRKDLAKVFAEKFPNVKVVSDSVQDIRSFIQTLRAGRVVWGLMLADMSTKVEVGESPNWFAGHTAPVSQDLFVRIVGEKSWEESKDFAATELVLLKNATEEVPLKIEPPLSLDISARYKKATEEIQQLRSLFSQGQEKYVGPSKPLVEKTLEN